MNKFLRAGAAAFGAMIVAQSASAVTMVQSCGSNATPTCTINFTGTNGTYGNTSVTVSPFTDSYLFDLGTGTLSLDLTTSFANAVQNIDFSLVQLGIGGSTTVIPFVADTDETYRIQNLAVTAGQYLLTLQGARASGNGRFDASYTGNINFSAATAAVPEPASWALMVGGFGLIGGALRRRSRTNFNFA